MKNKYVAALLCFLVGELGIHEFYLGNTGRGVVYLILTIGSIFTGGILLIPIGIVLLIQTIVLLAMNQATFDAKYNAGATTAPRAETPRYQPENQFYSQPNNRTPIAPAKTQKSVSEILTEYKLMLDQGLITQEEYDAKKRSLLSELH